MCTTNKVYRQNLSYKPHQISKLQCFSSRLVIIFAKYIEAKCWGQNEDVVGLSNYIWVINKLIAYYTASYIRDLTVLYFIAAYHRQNTPANNVSQITPSIRHGNSLSNIYLGAMGYLSVYQMYHMCEWSQIAHMDKCVPCSDDSRVLLLRKVQMII